MSRHQLEAYLDKVFDFSQLVDALPEGRHFPQHPWKKVFDTVFLGAAMQIPSLLQIEAECGGGALAKRIGPISDDTIGYALQRQSPEPVFALGCEIARRLKRNGVLRSDWSRGLVVAAVDGIEVIDRDSVVPLRPIIAGAGASPVPHQVAGLIEFENRRRRTAAARHGRVHGGVQFVGFERSRTIKNPNMTLGIHRYANGLAEDQDEQE